MSLPAEKTNIDLYPSRNSHPAVILARTEPVVYNKSVEQSPVSHELIQQYKEKGFLVMDNVFTQSEIKSFKQEMERLKERADEMSNHNEMIIEPESGEVRSIFKIHESSYIYNKLSQDNRLAGLAEFILNDQVYIHQSRLNYKPGFRGKEFYWHSDFETWHVEDGMPRMRALSMSITLTDNNFYNGPLMLIPGSHNDFVVCSGKTPKNNFKESLRKQTYGVPSDKNLEKLVDQYGIFTATGKAGSVVIFDCNTMHGSNGNITPFPRSNIFLVYNAISNRVVEPFSGLPARPEWIASRDSVNLIKSVEHQTISYE